MKSLATFAMGCFWQPDYVFSKVKGVISRRVGYTGCSKHCKNPSYEDVCSGSTNCAEAIEIEFDSSKITYSDLLDIFWKSHDPTQMNMQGPDIGSQYRSAIFYHDKKQYEEILKSKAKWQLKLKDKNKKIVTEITKADYFYEAEKYHQEFLAKTGRTCHISISPFK